jgi:mRNA interferase MazF
MFPPVVMRQWVGFNPQAGHEQAGRGPAVVLTDSGHLQRKAWSANILCLITNQIKGYPFEVTIPNGLKVTGARLCDKAKSLDWRARKAELICNRAATPHPWEGDTWRKTKYLTP